MIHVELPLDCKLMCISTGLELIRAGAEHQSALANLLELYIYDSSVLVPMDVGDDGRFGYRNFSLYWSDDSRLPFLARLHGKLLGFALVTPNSEPFSDGQVWDIAEFFVLRRYQHRGSLSGPCRPEWSPNGTEGNVGEAI